MDGRRLLDRLNPLWYRPLPFRGLLLALLLVGCGKSPSNSPAPPQEPAKVLSARQRLQRMIHAYQDMPRYHDRAILKLGYTQNGETYHDTTPMSVSFDRPNRIRFDVYQVRLVCDGRRMRAKILDPSTQDLDGQMLDLPAPERLSLPILYGDPLLHEFIREGLAGYPVQLELLLADEPLQPLFDSADSLEVLEPQAIDGHACHGVQAQLGPSRYVFWIDDKKHLLRRLEFPTEPLSEMLSALGPVADLRLTIDYTSASFDERITDEHLRWDLPPEAKSVKSFVVPPRQDPDDVARYEQQLATAMRGGDIGIPVAAPRAAIAEPVAPRHLSLTRLWHNEDVIAPGNAVVVGGERGTRIVVLDGWRTVVELDERGDILKRQTLDLPPHAGVNRIRVMHDRSGRRYTALFATLAPHVFLFDENWQRLWSYPPEGETKPGIYDVAFLSSEDDAPAVLIAFHQPLGVHAVSLDGTLRWMNRTAPTATSLAVPQFRSPSADCFVTTESGDVVPLADGKSRPPLSVKNWPLSALTGDAGSGGRATSHAATSAPLCGLSHDLAGNPVAIALDTYLREQWTYRLPAGWLETAVEPITATDLLDAAGQWMFAGADGTVHIVSCDGEFADYLATGVRVSGLAAGVVAGKRSLIICSAQGVECLAVLREQP